MIWNTSGRIESWITEPWATWSYFWYANSIRLYTLFSIQAASCGRTAAPVPIPMHLR